MKQAHNDSFMMMKRRLYDDHERIAPIEVGAECFHDVNLRRPPI